MCAVSTLAVEFASNAKTRAYRRRLHIAFIDFLGAVSAGVSVGANAGIGVQLVLARGAVLAWLRGTVVNVNVAHLPRVARVAQTCEAVDFVTALAVDTWAAQVKRRVLRRMSE